MKFRRVNAAGQSSPAAFQSSSTKVNASPLPRKSLSKFRKSFSPAKTQSDNEDSRKSLPSSSNKRLKFEAAVEYPTEVPIPSKAIIKALYQCAVKDPDSHQNQLDEKDSGLLSLEEVFLPAVIAEEVEALKRVQAKAQRDTPHHVKSLEMCRRALYESGAYAIEKTREARLIRQEQEAKQIALREEEKRQVKEQRRMEKEAARKIRREERAVAKAAEKERRKRELKKKLPQNVELWREVALFVSELTKLEKEERMWKETEANLKNRERELSVREQEQVHEEETEEPMENTKHDLEVRVEHAVEDITLSSLRIQQALRLVSGLVSQSNATQKELYDTYTKDHQFHGYRGVNNPKALIRALATD